MRTNTCTHTLGLQVKNICGPSAVFGVVDREREVATCQEKWPGPTIQKQHKGGRMVVRNRLRNSFPRYNNHNSSRRVADRCFCYYSRCCRFRPWSASLLRERSSESERVREREREREEQYNFTTTTAIATATTTTNTATIKLLQYNGTDRSSFF